MKLQKTTLEDISSVIGFTATLRLSAWFGDRTSPCYVPTVATDGQLITRLVGLPAAKALSKEWGGEHIAVARVLEYEQDIRKKAIGRMFEKGFGSREIAAHLRISERRVQQICRELEVVGLIAIVGPRENEDDSSEQNEGAFVPEKMPEKPTKKSGALCPQESRVNLPASFFGAQPGSTPLATAS